MAHIPSNHTISALIIGEGDLTWRCIHQILNQGLSVSALISRNSNLISRAQSQHLLAFHIESPSPFLIPAEEDPSELINDSPAYLESIEFDVIISVENSLLIPETLLARSRLGLIQFYPGNPNHNFDLNPLSWALIRQDISHQISWCHLDHASTSPNLIASESVPLAPTDTLESLLERVHLKALTSLNKIVTQVLPTVASTSGETHFLRQENRSTSFQRHPGLTWIDWMWSASLIQNLVRATQCLPSINTFGLVKFHHHAQFFIVRECHTVSADHPVSGSASPGTVINYSPDGLTVQTAEGALLLSVIQKLNGQLVEFPQLFSAGDQLLEPHSMDFHSTQHLRAEKWIHETAQFEFFWADHIQKSQPFDLPAYWFSHPKHPESSAASPICAG
ncbi:MAG: hypothetical protein LR011_03845 [Verrucomicrobia bacterium]|nr:hypothetical protein [Verrucomicrobiota bacterium]